MKTLPATVVLILLGLLIALLMFPRVGQGISAGPRVQAKSDVTQIVGAVETYQSEYGQFSSREARKVIRALRGENSRKTVFLEIDPNRLSEIGDFLDPWGEPYAIFVSEAGVRAYSFGRNRRDEMGGGDDVASW